MNTLVGRKVFLDWGDKVIAIEIYKPEYKPQSLINNPPTEGKVGFIPKIFDIHDICGETVLMNPQDISNSNPEGRDANWYLMNGFFGVKDAEEINMGKLDL